MIGHTLLVKLRDLPYNEWNVDTLYLLAPDKEAADKLAEIFNMEEWGGMISVYGDPKDVDSALGSGREPSSLSGGISGIFTSRSAASGIRADVCCGSIGKTLKPYLLRQASMKFSYGC